MAVATENVCVGSPLSEAVEASRLFNSVAVVPSSVADCPVRTTMNCASTAAMIELWRQTLLS
ncbi:hypothetical protein DF052_00025 [Burkholderia glumae]|nr:hypothetical protein DF052_00025 [Burkholderia glumae]